MTPCATPGCDALVTPPERYCAACRQRRAERLADLHLVPIQFVPKKDRRSA